MFSNTELASAYRNIYMYNQHPDFGKYKWENNNMLFHFASNSPNFIYYICMITIFGTKCRNDYKTRTEEYLKSLKNTFMKENDYNIITNTFCKILSMKRRFSKILRLWKWRKTPVYNTEDLLMSPIYPGQKNTITIMDNNKKYVFSIRDLIGNFDRELSNSPNLFATPIPCKNPYTNQTFRKSDLYNIYFAIRESTFIMPTLFHLYFKENFNISRFMNICEYNIREEYIDKYTNRITNDIIRESVNDMFRAHNMSMRVHLEFPSSELKSLMGPYLKLYYESIYSFNKWKKADAYVKLHLMLHKLNSTYPGFGRVNYKGKHMKTIPEPDKEFIYEFMNSHLNLKEAESSRLMYSYNVMRTTNQGNRYIEPVGPQDRRRIRPFVQDDEINVSVMIPISQIESNSDTEDEPDSESETVVDESEQAQAQAESGAQEEEGQI